MTDQNLAYMFIGVVVGFILALLITTLLRDTYRHGQIDAIQGEIHYYQTTDYAIDRRWIYTAENIALNGCD